MSIKKNNKEKTTRPWFKLRIKLSSHQRFNSCESEMSFHLNDEKKDIQVCSAPPGPLDKAEIIDFNVLGFNSCEEAHKAGLRLQNAIMMAASINRIGLDAGADQTLGNDSKQKRETMGYHIKNEMHGLTIYDKGEYPRPYMEAYMESLPDPLDFFKDINNAFTINQNCSDREILAIELYNLSQFEASSRAKLMALTTVIEVLSVCEKRSQESVDVIERLIKEVSSSSIDRYQKESLINGIQNLKRESISQACKNIIQQFLGEENATRFSDIYKLRCKLIHEGNSYKIKKNEIEKEINWLEIMIIKIFKKMFFSETKYQ